MAHIDSQLFYRKLVEDPAIDGSKIEAVHCPDSTPGNWVIEWDGTETTAETDAADAIVSGWVQATEEAAQNGRDKICKCSAVPAYDTTGDLPAAADWPGHMARITTGGDADKLAVSNGTSWKLYSPDA